MIKNTASATAFFDLQINCGEEEAGLGLANRKMQ